MPVLFPLFSSVFYHTAVCWRLRSRIIPWINRRVDRRIFAVTEQWCRLLDIEIFPSMLIYCYARKGWKWQFSWLVWSIYCDWILWKCVFSSYSYKRNGELGCGRHETFFFSFKETLRSYRTSDSGNDSSDRWVKRKCRYFQLRVHQNH